MLLQQSIRMRCIHSPFLLLFTQTRSRCGSVMLAGPRRLRHREEYVSARPRSYELAVCPPSVLSSRRRTLCSLLCNPHFPLRIPTRYALTDPSVGPVVDMKAFSQFVPCQAKRLKPIIFTPPFFSP